MVQAVGHLDQQVISVALESSGWNGLLRPGLLFVHHRQYDNDRGRTQDGQSRPPIGLRRRLVGWFGRPAGSPIPMAKGPPPNNLDE